MNILDVAKVQKSLATGSFKPHMFLTNMSMAFFQEANDFAYGKIFPRVPVQLPVSKYYTFSLEDLATDQVARKPEFGKVQPAVMGHTTESYECVVDQVIVGIDEIQSNVYQRAGVPGASDPRKGRVRFATEQINLHLDKIFAENFFKEGVWTNEWSGVTTTPSTNQFYKFDNANSDPIQTIDKIKTDIKRKTRRMPNKIAVGAETFDALKNNPCVLERVKMGGSTANPATVNEKVLAELFGVQEVVQLLSSYNAAGLGEDPDMQFVCDSKALLVCYAPDGPAIDEPSAGYTFSWDMLGGGQPIVFSQWPGEGGTHSEFIEGLCGYDMKKTCDDLACFLADCVA